MDEEDGRPGAVARKSGHLDATDGVLMDSLSLPRFTRLRALILCNFRKIPSNPRKCHPERAQRVRAPQQQLFVAGVGVEGPAFSLVLINSIPRFFLARTSRRQLAPPQVAISPTAGGQGEHHENLPGK
jgi:hypothetical protein